jgi:hypothetical protein
VNIKALCGWLPLVLLFGVFATTGRSDTITLQQGINNYSGCSDTYICNGGSFEDSPLNFSINRFLIVNANGCDS